MNELTKRTLSGALMIAMALTVAVLGGTWFAVLVAAAAAVMFYEWTRMVRGWGFHWQFAGFIYALIPALALLWIRERGVGAVGGAGGGGEHKLKMLLWVFIITWSTDIGAYFAGRAIGGARLAPTISPNKTWAGLAGGVVAASLLGGLWVYHFHLPRLLLLLAPVFAVGAQMGDLFESGLKRRAGVKDSGAILPGHGGMLDRLDGLVVVATLTATFQLAGSL